MKKVLLSIVLLAGSLMGFAQEDKVLLTINGEPVVPPTPWQELGAYAYHFSTYKYGDIQSLPWTNEQLFWMREPAKIKLRKGWNTVLIEAPLLYTTPFWFVSFVPVGMDENGRLLEVEGLDYRSPK